MFPIICQGGFVFCAMPIPQAADFRRYRNSRLYRSLTRVLRIYNQRLVRELHDRGYEEFSPAFPSILSNLDTEGTRIGVLAKRAGVTRQAAGQLIREIEKAGFVSLRSAPDDARATIVSFTPRGRKLLSTVVMLVERIEADFASVLPMGEMDRLRVNLGALADSIDPDGAFGTVDEPLRKSRSAPRSGG
jgi:DNA-binding MarR family transcriptional regulator